GLLALVTLVCVWQAEVGMRVARVPGVEPCALPVSLGPSPDANRAFRFHSSPAAHLEGKRKARFPSGLGPRAEVTISGPAPKGGRSAVGSAGQESGVRPVPPARPSRRG